MQRKNFILALGALFLVLTVSGARADTQAEAGKFVKGLADHVLAIFQNPAYTMEQKEERMFPIAVSSFDVPRAARFVLGRFCKDAPASQREQFTSVFEHYMVHIYTGQFDIYHDVDFDVAYTRPEDTVRTFVRTKITRQDGRPPLNVDWRVNKVGNSFKILDVSVEGVSQLLTLRDQFVTVIEQHDDSVAALIEHLREKTAEKYTE